jgi:hypothetical protein
MWGPVRFQKALACQCYYVVRQVHTHLLCEPCGFNQQKMGRRLSSSTSQVGQSAPCQIPRGALGCKYFYATNRLHSQACDFDEPCENRQCMDQNLSAVASENGLGLGRRCLDPQGHIDQESEKHQPAEEHHNFPHPGLCVFLRAHPPLSCSIQIMSCGLMSSQGNLQDGIADAKQF